MHLEEPGVHPDESPETSRAGDLDSPHEPWLRQSGRMFSNVQGSTGKNRGKRTRHFITSTSLRCQYGKTTNFMLYLFGDCGIKSEIIATFQLGCQTILKVTLTCFQADLPAGGSRSFSRSPMKLSVGVSNRSVVSKNRTLTDCWKDRMRDRFFKLNLTQKNMRGETMNWNDLEVHHIGIVVEDIEKAKKPYEEVFGLEVVQVFDVEAFAAKVAFLFVKNTYIELVQPNNAEDGLGKFLKRGGGMHHICYEVENIERFFEEVKKKNVRSLTQKPEWTPCFEKVLFLHPKDTGNILIEVVEKATCKLPGCKY